MKQKRIINIELEKILLDMEKDSLEGCMDDKPMRERAIRRILHVMKNYWYHAGEWHTAECSFLLYDQGVCNCDLANPTGKEK